MARTLMHWKAISILVAYFDVAVVSLEVIATPINSVVIWVVQVYKQYVVILVLGFT